MGGVIGVNSDKMAIDGLVCNGTDTSIMYVVPGYSSQPNIIDVHMYPQVMFTTNTDSQIEAVAKLDFGDLPHFLTLAGLTSATVVIGETWGGKISPATQPGGTLCWTGAYATPPGAPSDTVAGFNNEGVSPPLSNYTVTFRPWMELQFPSGACFAYGGGPGPSTPTNYQDVNYGNLGPYTPTNY